MALKHGLKCLAFTWKPIARTSIGEKNLKNLISLGVDHIDWTINPKLEKKMMLISLKNLVLQRYQCILLYIIYLDIYQLN